ncbi:MAG: circadian clock protein KaiC, partial [Thermoplasmata archaeon]|nr:circadian clock protein KaiC [Thermoplasmata archaeon]
MKRVPTGIAGLDELVNGGFPENTINLVSGPAGSAKSLLGLHYIFSGAEKGEPGIYMTLEENRSNIERALNNYGMGIDKLESEGMLYLMDMSEIRRKCPEEDLEAGIAGFSALENLLNNLLDYTKAKRLVLDSLTAVGLYYGDNPGILRRELFRFAGFLKEKNVTALLITESLESGQLTRYGIEQFVADSFIVLGLEDVKGE